MTKLPNTTEEQIRKMAGQPEYAQGTTGRNWLNIQADLAGVDRDYRYGFDDEIISNQKEEYDE